MNDLAGSPQDSDRGANPLEKDRSSKFEVNVQGPERVETLNLEH
jgi:hypothetical protein